MLKIIIELENKSLSDNAIAEVLESVASTIRNQEMVDLMDGTYHVNTDHGNVWVHFAD